MKLNINNKCKVTLLQKGVEAIEHHYAELGLEPPHYEVGDTYVGPLWEVMNIFGKYTYMGPMPPFQTEIEFI